MYTPKHFGMTDEAAIRALVEDYPFGTFIVPRADGVEVTHLPFVYDPAPGPHGQLRVHVARANRILNDVTSPSRPGDILAVFHGPHGYISTQWYEPSDENVPTWNYAVVHAHITAPRVMEPAELEALLDEIARRNEPGPKPWRPQDQPAEPHAKLFKGIAGLVLPVARWDAKFKLSQNRTPADQARVVDALTARGTADDLAMVAMMRKG